MKDSSRLILAAGVAGFLFAAAIANSGPIQTLAKLVSAQPVGSYQHEASAARTESPEPSESPEDSPTAEPSQEPRPSPSARHDDDSSQGDEDSQGDDSDEIHVDTSPTPPASPSGEQHDD